jgi:hypothetical protein
MHEGVQLSAALRDDLPTAAWASAFGAIRYGTLPAVAIEDSKNSWASKLWVPERALNKALRQARAAPLPAVEIAMRVAAPIIGMNQVMLARIVDAGMLRKGPNGIALQELANFREIYIGPGEIARWFKLSGHQFANTMSRGGAWQVGSFHQANLWLRAEVERVFKIEAKRNQALSRRS